LRTLRLSVIALIVGAIAFACDPSPTAVESAGLLAARTTSTNTSNRTPTGLVSCGQTYDSVTQVIGPRGGYVAVGPHYLFVDSLVLSAPVSITAVAPTATVRWVRFKPNGLLFPTNPRDGWGALIYTNYTNCSVPTAATLQIAQVSDSLGILAYLQTVSKTNKNPWSKATQYVAALLPHFSNYAVAW